MGYTFGGGVKFALSAFEPAWGPFVYAQAQAGRRRGHAGPRRHLRLRGVRWRRAWPWPCSAASLLALMTPRNPAFRAGGPDHPGGGARLPAPRRLPADLGRASASSRQARYYPMVTAAAAATNCRELRLIPRFGHDGRGLGHRARLRGDGRARLRRSRGASSRSRSRAGGSLRITAAARGRLCAQRAGSRRRAPCAATLAGGRPARLPARGAGPWCAAPRREAAAPSYIRARG